jgi:hypothetical protein
MNIRVEVIVRKLWSGYMAGDLSSSAQLPIVSYLAG